MGSRVSCPVVSCLGPGRISKLANIRSLAEVDRDLGNGNEWKIAGFDATVTALVLAGCGKHAKELIDSFEAQPGNKERWQTWSRNQRALLDRDAASLGGEFRSEEEKIARVHRLGDAWEPSPFSIEVPEVEREQRCDEPPFPARRGLCPRPGWSTRRRRSRVRSASPASRSGARAAWSWSSR